MQRIKMILGGFFENCFRVFRKFIFSVVSVGPIPTHIAFIMDGNRRYARKHKLKEGAGHRIGLFALMSMLKYCYELGVKYVTVYAFSIDNFNREPKEVQYMMTLVEEKIEELLMEGSIVSKFWVRLHFIGNLKLLNATTRAAAERAMTATAMNNNLVLVICLAYSSTDEVVNAVQKSYENKWCKLQGLDSSGCGSDEIRLVDRSHLEKHMYMSVTPEPDILIRTSGAKRLSNFLLWQSTHAYLYSPSALWPDISVWHLIWVVLNFQRVQHNLEKKKKLL
ncbi:hypothetical protein MKW98_004588 [Papaver atlanticum]|uniref:Alkyl transferase n=1 Tax=Papaver atlanticum TaxID=357466 RepID=A0AAD4SNE6_9MAGN|nr:hypothetical protein MKW98_004588 [Papaver atlanticum]